VGAQQIFSANPPAGGKPKENRCPAIGGGKPSSLRKK